jgi:fructokinase
MRKMSKETRGGESRPEVVVFGEALVDFYPETPGRALREVERFVRSVGGAPANLSVGLARLGTKVKMLTKLGDDEFGYFLHDALRAEGVDVTGVKFTGAAPTGMTFISLDAQGQRSFTSCTRQHSAEWAMEGGDFEDEPFGEVAAFHVGSNLLPRRAGAAATFALLGKARAAGCLVSMDANLRLHHWADPQDALGVIREAMSYVDILKVSDEEMAYFLDGEDNPVAMYEQARRLGVRWVCVTRGAAGVRLLGEGVDVEVEAPHVAVVDTTGAGDGFCAGLLHGMLRQAKRTALRGPAALAALTPDSWRGVLRLANYVGAQVCTQMGATTSLPQAAAVPWSDLA